MNYKCLLGLILSSHLAALSPERAVKLLDQLHEAQAYWESMARDKKLGFWKRPPHKWFSKTWKSELAAHQRDLEKQRAELIDYLATIAESPKSISFYEASVIQTRAGKTLAVHGTPSHFNRRWLSYAGMAATVAAVALYLHRFRQAHTLFILAPQSPSVASSLHDGTPFLGYDYVNAQGKQYFQVKRVEEEQAQKFLKTRNITYEKSSPQLSLCWYTQEGEHKVREFVRVHGVEPVQEIYKILRNENPTKTQILTTDIDFDQKQYEEQLTLVLHNAQKIEQTAPTVKKFLKGRKVEDLDFSEKRNGFTALLFSLGDIVPEEMRSSIHQLHRQTTATSTPVAPPPAAAAAAEEPATPEERGLKPWSQGFQDLKKNFEVLEKKIDHLRNPHEIPASKSTITEVTPIYIPFNPGADELAQNINRVVKKGDDIANKIAPLLVEAQQGINQGKELLSVMKEMTQKNTDLAALIVQVIITNAFEIKLKGAALGHEIHNFAQRSKLNVELSATIPLMLASYAGYLVAKGVYRHATALTMLTPLKQDLLSLQLLLNKERYTKEIIALPKEFRGEYFYWVQRLHRYQAKLPSKYRPTYRRYLDELENKELLPEQKMTIIDCLFAQLDPLFVEQ